MVSLKRLAPSLVAVLVLAACGESLAPNGTLSDEEAADIVLEADATAGTIVFGEMLLGGFPFEGGIAVNGADVREFSRSRDCPLGGTITVAGQIERNRTDAGADFHATAEGAWNDCKRGNRRNDHTFTVVGTFSIESFRKVDAERKLVGPQTTTKKGSFTVTRDDGESRSCEYDITSTRYPEENKRVVVGTVCGREINREVTWSRSDG